MYPGRTTHLYAFPCCLLQQPLLPSPPPHALPTRRAFPGLLFQLAMPVGDGAGDVHVVAGDDMLMTPSPRAH
jgi:hypothetical protein